MGGEAEEEGAVTVREKKREGEGEGVREKENESEKMSLHHRLGRKMGFGGKCFWSFYVLFFGLLLLFLFQNFLFLPSFL